MKTVTLPTGQALPALGLGTWRLGEQAGTHAAEVAAVRTALQLGYRLLDTAEMYGEGGAERVVGEAVAGAVRAGEVRREQVVVVSKVYPHHASREGTVQACERSLARLDLDRIDLYLLHWRGDHPLTETVEAMRHLVAAGRIRHWGVSNFDVDDMVELQQAEQRAGAGGPRCATNQIYYSASERGPEYGLLPWLEAQHIPVMAYSPIDQGALAGDTALQALASQRGLTAAQLALAWVMSRPGVMAIPKAVQTAHLRDNLAAAEVTLTAQERAHLEARFPAPSAKTPLAMI